ncbi:MAG: hypothetical protein IT445_05485 [Phycisphaeraceae bacterium]|nr:hypothetical protein [Phycisphaeraceae bacterium]
MIGVTRNLTFALGAAVLLLVVTWIACQGGLAPVMPIKYLAMWAAIASALPVLAIYWAGALGYGGLLQRIMVATTYRDAVTAAGLGLWAMLMSAWLLAWAGLLNQYVAWALPGVGAAIWASRTLRVRLRNSGYAVPGSVATLLAWLLPGAGVGLMLVGATCPPGTIWRTEALGYDVLSYHLQIPREWLAAGAMTPLEHNVYSFLPGLFEAGYLHLSAMRGSVHGAIFACQLLHVSTALLAACAIGSAVRRLGGTTGAAVAGASLLVVPWVMITSSLAYNEMAMLALAAVAFSQVYAEKPSGPVVGLLCAGSTLCKLTAGPMLAVPIGVMLLLRRQWRAAALAAVVGSAALCPYFARNVMWTGNPVFPFAAQTLGKGYWNDELVARWQRGVGLAEAQTDGRIESLYRQWLTNTGYGAIGGQRVPIEVRNIARFDQEGGFPILLAAAAVAAGLALRRRNRAGLYESGFRGRGVIVQMAVMLAMQLVFWLSATHMQSRFLLPTLLPTLMVLGIGMEELIRIAGPQRKWVGPFGGVVLVTLLWIVSLNTLFSQTMRTFDEPTQQSVNVPPWLLVDSLEDFSFHPINELPPQSRVYIVADNSHLLYIDRPMIYHSAFDPSLLGGIIRDAGGPRNLDPRQVNQTLRDLGVTHVWVHRQELKRLHETYGYDSDVTQQSLDRLIDSGWLPVRSFSPSVTLYQLPRE